MTVSPTRPAAATSGQLPSPPLRGTAAPASLPGRDGELAELRAILESPAEDAALTLVSGEAGIGKTRLLAELAAIASGAGRTVLYGRCEPRAIAPYEPFVRALRSVPASERLEQLPAGVRRQVATLLPSWLATERGPGRALFNADLEQLRLFDAVVAALDALGGPGGGVLILEDMHWAEPSTLALLAHLAGEGAPHRLHVFCTARDPDPDRGELLAPALARVERGNAVRRLPLSGLDTRGVGALVSGWCGSEAPLPLAAELRELTGGNPLLIHSTLAHLGQGALRTADGTLAAHLPAAAANAAPADIVELVREHLGRLGEQAQALLTAGSLIGADFALDEAREAAAMGLEEAVEAAEAAEAAGLVRQHGEPAMTVSFEHGLIRHAVASTLGPSRRALLHLRIAEVVEATGSAPRRHAELAQHYGEALGFGGAERALEHALAAADEAEAQLAAEEAAANLELALRALDTLGNRGWRERYGLLLRLGRARYRTSGPSAALPRFAEAADLADANGAREEVARAGLGVGLERYLRYVGVDELALRLLDRALEALDGSRTTLRARVMSARALERCFLDPLDVREREMTAAVELADSLDDRETAVVARTVRQTVLWHPRHTLALLRHARPLAAIARDCGRLDLAMHVHCTAFGYALELGRRTQLDAHLEYAQRAAAELRVPVQRLRTLTLEIFRLIVSGELDEAESQISGPWLLMDESHAPLTQPVRQLWAFMLARERGDVGELREAFEAGVAASPEAGVARAVLADICARSRDGEAARAHLDVLAAHDFADVHEDFLWLCVLTLSADVAATLRDSARAERLYELLLPHAGRNVVLGLAAADRPVCHALGLLARTLGRPDEAVSHFERAAADAGEFGAPPWRAAALLELGVTLRRAGRVGDAREPLREALDLADRFGGENTAKRARHELQAAGLRPRRARLSGADALTASEQRVVDLAVAGMSNDDIARELVLARRTVETHLTHAYRKLGISRRDQLAAALSA